MTDRGRLTSTGILLEPGESRGLFSCFSKRLNKIKYEDILAIEERQIGHFLVRFVDRNTKPCRLTSRLVRIDKNEPSQTNSPPSSQSALGQFHAENEEPSDIASTVLARAYSGCHSPEGRLPILILVNPHSGPGRAYDGFMKHAAPVFAAAGLKTEVIISKYRGHAVEIAKSLPLDKHDTIVSVSGDGMPHEVLNGLASREDSAKALAHFGLAQLPGGSGNAMCNSLNSGVEDWTVAALGVIKGAAEPVDIMGISQNNNYFYSFLSQSYGIVADCDLGTEDLRWMGGARFTVGIVWKCLLQHKYPCEIAYEEAESGGQATAAATTSAASSASNTQRLTVNDPIPSNWKVETHKDLSMFYAGKMVYMSGDAKVFPRSEPLDGAVDMIIWDNSFGRISALNALLKLETGTHVSSIPFYKKIRAYRLTPLAHDQLLSIDGESYPCEPFQVELIPAAARFVVPCI